MDAVKLFAMFSQLGNREWLKKTPEFRSGAECIEWWKTFQKKRWEQVGKTRLFILNISRFPNLWVDDKDEKIIIKLSLVGES